MKTALLGSHTLRRQVDLANFSASYGPPLNWEVEDQRAPEP